jgi:hypothetical protein
VSAESPNQELAEPGTRRTGNSPNRLKRTRPRGKDGDRVRAGSGGSLLRAVGHPAVVLLTLTGLMSMLADTRILDGLVLVVVALVLVWDSVRAGGTTPPATAGGTPAVAGLITAWRRMLVSMSSGRATIGGCLLALLVGCFERYSWPATVAVWALATVQLLVCWPQTPTEPGPPPRHGALIWIGWMVVTGLWELSALLQQPTLTTGSRAHPTISVLLEPFLATYPGRVVTFGAWLAAGWSLARRAAR